MKLRPFLLSLGATALCLTLATPAKAAVALTMLAAPNAHEAVQDAVSVYEKSHPDVSIAVTYNGTKVIAKEVSQGVPIDLIVIGATAMDGLSAFIDAPAPLFREHTAIAVAKSAGGKIRDARDLAKLGIRIGKGVPGTFAGDFQQAVTTKLTALYGKDFAAKYDTNASVSRLDTGKLTALIEADSVDAAIVFAAEIDTKKMSIVALPTEATVTIPYSSAFVKVSQHVAETKALLAWRGGADGQAIFHAHRHDPK